MHDAKSNLSKLVALVAGGEEVVIARDGKPVARLVPYDEDELPLIPFGFWKGQVWTSDDFYDDSEMDALIEERMNRPME